MALHHKFCQALGGSFGLPHATASNVPAAPAAVARVARVLGTNDTAPGPHDLAGRLGVKRALRDIGRPADGIGEVAERTVDDPSWNPRPLDRDAIRDLLTRAWSGEPPCSA